jgi:ubiquinone/menaquinone biosynthesis C-methylase UbiE
MSRGRLPAAYLTVYELRSHEIEFGDNGFDFADSSSVVEHIGGWDEFRRHLSEVKRVLKRGSVYVPTTEISYGNTIEARGNYKFN